MITLKNAAKVFLGIMIFVFLSSLVRDAFRFYSFQSSLESAEKELRSLQREGEDLEAKKRYLTSDGYKEIQIRDKLGLAKENELVIVLPNPEILRKLSPRVVQQEEFDLPQKSWEMWKDIFFRKLIS